MIRLFLIPVLICIWSCYTFSGASIHPDAKTIRIENFPNYSPLQDPNLSQNFTIKLQDKFLQRTRLILVNEPADMNISGEIVNYDLQPVNVQQGAQAAQNRLTMTVKVTYESKYEPKKNFTKQISDFIDFDGAETLNTIQLSGSEEILNRLAERIFNEIAVDW